MRTRDSSSGGVLLVGMICEKTDFTLRDMNTEQLHKLFNGLATIAEIEKIKGWVEEAPENRDSFIKERRLFDAVMLLKSGRDFAGRLNQLTRKKKSRPYVGVLKYAAVASIVFLAAFLFAERRNAGLYSQIQKVTVPAGQRANITLPDGTNVWLNSKSTLEYPLAFGKKDRRVSLDGQAYFDVTKDRKRPFTVKTSMATVDVLGTKFDVMSFSGSGQFKAMLDEGKVKITADCDPDNEVILAPATKAELDDGKLIVSQVVDFNPYVWKEGLIAFSNCSFLEMMEEFERNYDTEIRINNSNVCKYLYSGKFRIADGLDYALQILQHDINFTYEKDPERNVVIIK